jgi:hypothetical protein
MSLDILEDEEFLWEEQAAASKDGFFVPEGERPVFEKFVRQIFIHFDPLLIRCYRADLPKLGWGGRGCSRGVSRGTTSTRGGGGRGSNRKPRIMRKEIFLSAIQRQRMAASLSSIGGTANVVSYARY